MFKQYQTVQNTVTLYERAKLNQPEFRGKTREDFVSLEASIHDCNGTSPAQERFIDTPKSSIIDRNQHAAAISLQELSSGSSQWLGVVGGVQQAPEIGTIVDDAWNQAPWPIWGDEHFMPFYGGGLPFELNLDFITGQHQDDVAADPRR